MCRVLFSVQTAERCSCCCRLHTNAMAQALRVVVDAGSGRGWSLGPQVTSLWLAAQQIGQEPQLSRWDVAAALLRRGLLSLQDIDGHVSAVRCDTASEHLSLALAVGILCIVAGLGVHCIA